MFDRYQREIHYLRLSVTDLCNLRCRYCMPDGVEKLEREAVLTYEEFLRLAALFARCGIDTVRVTGGEPLVRKNVAQLVAGLKETPGIRRVTLTTNAVLLAEQLPALLDAGLDSVNISLDTLRPEVFRQITARDDFAAVQAGLQAALESGLPVKLNCVPQAGVNEGELEQLAALAKDNAMQVRFIEMMPIGYGAAMPCISGPELRARFARRWPELAPLSPAQEHALGDGPAVYYTVPGWQGSIGFIAAVHGKFCASCNRVRLTSQGFLRPCLASETGCDLRALLRSGADDAQLLAAIRETIWAKPREHHFNDSSMPATRGMYRIGG
ncbi:GTP 3',8-cyclase MoaA [Faecalibacterium sp. IP-1-18]|uniref:GTP 3',8-cyclase MoaA n=1 Tax=Faecalibacterium sp. IP-1-18 TaxID=2929488 RepID=UPI002014AB9F|nr:GTP 3',8-cyclase MoaA [Faecalibacterium sp. IP-1-18]UQK54851.1 GTP 3',8-cyclase MoaA [Faecalibacterium sp. IP-1-18]